MPSEYPALCAVCGDVKPDRAVTMLDSTGIRYSLYLHSGPVIASGDRHLSHQGDWRWTPEPFLQRHYRWETQEDALLAARAWVDRRKVNGRTWAEWHAAQILEVANGEAHE